MEVKDKMHWSDGMAKALNERLHFQNPHFNPFALFENSITEKHIHFLSEKNTPYTNRQHTEMPVSHNRFVRSFAVCIETTSIYIFRFSFTDKTNDEILIIIIIIIRRRRRRRRRRRMIIIELKGAVRDFLFLQSPHCTANCLPHARSNGPGAIVCKSRATHTALITCITPCATWYEGTVQLLSLTGLKLHLFELYFISWTINRWRKSYTQSPWAQKIETV